MPARARLARSIARVEAAALPTRLSLPRVHPQAWLARFAPTRRSLAVGFGVLAVALGGYLDALPTVVSASYDRAFPHTLRITVVPERPAAVLRRGPDSWLVSRHGRVMERLPATAVPRLPRIWISTRTPVRTGAGLTAAGAAPAARAVGLAGAFAARIDSASVTNGTLVFHLRSGLALLLGDGGDIKLKVAVASRVLAILPTGSTFLDVSSPGRPVSGIGSPPALPPASSTRG